MNLGTGVFKAPKAGTYSFNVSFMKSATTADAGISLELNGSTRIGSTNAGTSGSNQSSSFHATLKLKIGDEITLVLRGGLLFDNPDFKTHFTGILVDEDLVIS